MAEKKEIFYLFTWLCMSAARMKEVWVILCIFLAFSLLVLEKVKGGKDAGGKGICLLLLFSRIFLC